MRDRISRSCPAFIRAVLRKGTVAIVCGLAIALAGASPALAADPNPSAPSPSGRQTVHKSWKSSKPLGRLDLRRSEATRGTAPFATPPGGGCTYNLEYDWTAYYLSHSLQSLVVAYNTQIVCTATGPGQNMGALATTAQLFKSLNEVSEATTQSCTDCLVTPVSGTVYVCDTGVACAGDYWVSNLSILGAPAGYAWPSAPPGCIGGPGSTPPYTFIECATVSDVFMIPPTL